MPGQFLGSSVPRPLHRTWNRWWCRRNSWWSWLYWISFMVSVNSSLLSPATNREHQCRTAPPPSLSHHKVPLLRYLHPPSSIVFTLTSAYSSSILLLPLRVYHSPISLPPRSQSSSIFSFRVATTLFDSSSTAVAIATFFGSSPSAVCSIGILNDFVSSPMKEREKEWEETLRSNLTLDLGWYIGAFTRRERWPV